MTNSLIDDCRAAFEEWTKPAALDLTGSENQWSRRYVYVHSHVEAMWCGWQAAWKAQAIKLDACIQEMTTGCPT